MRPELLLGRGTRAARVPHAPMCMRRRGDVLAIAVLIALPVLVFGVPALLGHPVLPGDDLTQNFPLRVLAGHQIQGGQLPLYDPYIWSGAPLLAGWNAGAAYPLTFLFALLPGTAAWTLNLIFTWAIAGLGTFFFLRALDLASLPSTLAALSFCFAGAMSAQVAHFGLVAGMSWVPLQLLGVLRLSEPRTTTSRLRWTGFLAGAVGLTILAGEPRAIDDASVIVFIYAAWRIARLGRRCGPAVLSVAAGVALGACLGAVQALPGLAALSTSQRAATSAAFFDSGSLPHRWLLLMLVPDLMGGSGSFGQPSFVASYNLAEVTGYVGIFPLVAAVALLGRLHLRPRPPEWLVWHVMAFVGVVLALGGNSPIGHLLVHLPLFGDQRLQSRNILVADLAFAVLLGYWIDQSFSRPTEPLSRSYGGRRMDWETVLGVLPPLAMIVVVVLGLRWGVGLFHWLRVRPDADHVDGRLKPWLVPYAVIGAGAIVFIIFGRRFPARLRSCWLSGFVVVDLVVFTLLGVVAVRPGLGSSVTATGGHDATTQTTAARPVAALGYRGRFALYDPGGLDARELPLLGSPDLNIISATPSVQGYSAIVDGLYASQTGSHQAMGEGQDVLSPKAVGDGTFDQLDTSLLLTESAYLITRAGGSGPAPGPPSTGVRDNAANTEATWYFATSLRASRVEMPDTRARQDVAAGTRLGLLLPDGSTRWFRARAASPSILAISLPHPMTSIAVIGHTGREPSHLGPPSIVASNGSVFVADGQLQNALRAPRWGFVGRDGPFAVFVNHFARSPLVLQALPGQSTSGASVRSVAGAATDPTEAAVSSPHGVRVIRAAADIPGWSATWHPHNGRPTALVVYRAGLVQAVDVPPGRGIVTWSYVSPGFTMGLAMSLGAVALLLILLLSGLRPQDRHRKGHRTDLPSPCRQVPGE